MAKKKVSRTMVAIFFVPVETLTLFFLLTVSNRFYNPYSYGDAFRFFYLRLAAIRDDFFVVGDCAKQLATHFPYCSVRSATIPLRCLLFVVVVVVVVLVGCCVHCIVAYNFGDDFVERIIFVVDCVAAVDYAAAVGYFFFFVDFHFHF